MNETQDVLFKLDDGQVLKGKFKDLTHTELLSLANQLYRHKNLSDARLVMRYQHRKFHEDNPGPPEAA